ncbi:MAG: class I SAM-dependent methyltransferase, partial [Candidatus Heimdallarchaeota archaeon]|nr:class I SAM-dependent methyltransferase [Candidatus Heimdallarchaeota archaeon]
LVNNLNFRIMSLFLIMRDKFRSPKKKLEGINLQDGYIILDYGAGLGSHTLPTAEIVGESGKVYAADINPLSIQTIKKAAKNRGLGNIETILVDVKNETGLEDNCVDIVFCFDMLGYVNRKNGARDRLIKEFHRVMKPKSLLYLNSYRITEKELISIVTGQNLFKFSKKLKKLLMFERR